MEVLEAIVVGDGGELLRRRFRLVNGQRVWVDAMPASWEAYNWGDHAPSCCSSDEDLEAGV